MVWLNIKVFNKKFYKQKTLLNIKLFSNKKTSFSNYSKIGIKFYISPNVTKLADPDVWLDAGTQVFFSYMIGIGTIVSLGSYNKYNFNVFKWSAFLCGFNCCASIISGFAIFSVLGFMSESMGIDIKGYSLKNTYLHKNYNIYI